MAQNRTPMESEDSTNLLDAAPAENDEALRKKLLSRIAVAGVVIAGLLGGLAVFDSLNRPQVPALPKMATLPEPPAVAQEPAKEEPAAAEDGDGDDRLAAEEGAEQAQDKLAETEAVPERSETPIAKPLTEPATARPAAVKPSGPVAATPRPDARREIARTTPPAPSAAPAVVPEGTRPAHAPASRPLTRAAENAAQRFLVQVGVFSNHVNAEELLQKLQAAGIPAQIESRVQVGPFASRAEVEAAREKLKALGIDDGILVRR